LWIGHTFSSMVPGDWSRWFSGGGNGPHDLDPLGSERPQAEADAALEMACRWRTTVTGSPLRPPREVPGRRILSPAILTATLRPLSRDRVSHSLVSSMSRTSEVARTSPGGVPGCHKAPKSIDMGRSCRGVDPHLIVV